MGTSNIENTQLFKKVLGCLAIGAIGDNLGRPVEGWHYKSIDEKFGRLEDPWAGVQGGDAGFEIGTDDTALGQILCHCYIDKGRPLLVEDYAEYWLKEMNPIKFFFCLRNTYELLKMGYSPRLSGVLNIVTGSGLMAINPVGIFNAGDPERAYVDGVNLASIVQRDLDMFIPGIIAAAIAEAFRPGATCDSVIDAAIRVAPSKPIVTFDERKPNNLKDTLIQAVEIASKYDDVFSAREGLYEKCLQYSAIDPQEVFALTFGIFKASKGDTRLAVVGGANTGRDADTLGSLNGQICGALNGVDSAPEGWMEGLKRSSGWGKFYDTALKMTELVIENKKKAQKQAEELNSLLS
jgi:ADP-ribosylglycohydrolase